MGKLLKSFLRLAVETSGNKPPTAAEIREQKEYERTKARLEAEQRLDQETDPKKRIEMIARLSAGRYDFSDL